METFSILCKKCNSEDCEVIVTQSHKEGGDELNAEVKCNTCENIEEVFK